MRDQEQRQPVNSSAARILGMPKGEIVGKDDAQLLPPETARRLAEADSRVMATGESSVYEEVLPVAGQSRTYLSTKGVPGSSHRGSLEGTTSTTT
jgi:hypothetical protein